ncbi:hypothetical protein I302_104052 [Kwoniella bestiolae CBS 10118]|uniref:Conserved oligomeric Golgi complex subunit 6 n=1 Tax=Kwoniella bestiolae CBS 10118 TaxID=1296100 RepID=A0A1B9GA56_9TREE|nr:hypothetical protein I302_02757 [Kwoniella bestiolae CBS 10118]OCF27907.1 hypothetical protein I302_02757 [Kwoniella bestiolae CBS 10118]
MSSLSSPPLAGSPSRSLSLSLSAPTTIPSSRTNPISLRIYKTIGTSFDDPSSREALELASSFYSTAEKGKGKADLSEQDEDLEGLPKRRTLRGQSASTARKWLKRDVESTLAGGSQKFLEAFAEVDQKLGVLREHMKEMQVRCDQVQSELDQANSGTKYLLERADGLRSQRASAQLRSSLINLFLSKFTLSETELAALGSREVAVGQSLFDALDRVEKIRKDCEVLLGGEEGKMQAGLDIMRATSDQMESGYKKIHRWCQFEFRQFTRETQLEVSPVMREGIRRLRDRPVLLKDALQGLTSTRSSSILQSFLDALTRGGPNGLPRPIELHAHDPTRYVGDMLAWVHQATASEHEFLDGLFGVREKRRMVGAERDMINPGEEEEMMVAQAMDKHLEGLGRPLKLRIQQTIKSQEGIIMAYKIANLLQFYLITMKKTIGEEALLCKTLQEIHDQAYIAFFENLDAQGRSLLRFLHPPDATLSPPLALRDFCLILRELLAVYSTSLVDPSERESDSDLAKLLDKSIDPCVEMCERMAEMRRSTVGGGSAGGDWEKDLFMVNCLGYLQHTLEVYDFTSRLVAMLEENIRGHVESMTFEHHGKLLEQCGLSPIMRAIRTRPADTPLSRLPTTSPKSLTAALSTFSTWLTTIDPSNSPRLALLSSARLAEIIHRKALRKINEAYGEVTERVLDPKEAYEFGETMLRRGREEVAIALGVGEEDEWDDEEGTMRLDDQQDTIEGGNVHDDSVVDKVEAQRGGNQEDGDGGIEIDENPSASVMRRDSGVGLGLNLDGNGDGSRTQNNSNE